MGEAVRRQETIAICFNSLCGYAATPAAPQVDENAEKLNHAGFQLLGSPHGDV